MNNRQPLTHTPAAARRLLILTVLGITCACAASALGHAAEADEDADHTPSYAWKRGEHSLALADGDRIVWQYNFDPAEGKPYFHPITLPEGTVLTHLRPADHRWHRALWFSWKFIDGVNYWEENRAGKSQGETELLEVQAEPVDDFSARFNIKLAYHPPDKPAVLTETRTITISAPRADGSFVIDWSATWKAGDREVLLDRTPIAGEPGGRNFGGYAGLSVRAAADMRGWTFLDSAGRTKPGDMHGQTAKWMTLASQAGGIALFDHPSNPRHPSPWYVAAQMPYFSPALLFNEPYTLPKKQSLKLRYFVLVHAAPADKAGLRAGDLIVAFNGKRGEKPGEDMGFDRLVELIKEHDAGDKVPLQILRNGRELTVPVVLDEWK